MSRETRIRRNDSVIADGQHRIEALIEGLGGLRVEHIIDQPDDPLGDWWIDIAFDGFEATVAWRYDRGFGIFTSDGGSFGARPDEIFREPSLAAKRLLQLAARKSGDITAMRLSEVRALVGKRQTELARSLERDQGFVSKVENQSDAKMSTVKAYVEALGGKVMVVVRFDDFEAPVELSNLNRVTVSEHAGEPVSKAQLVHYEAEHCFPMFRDLNIINSMIAETTETARSCGARPLAWEIPSACFATLPKGVVRRKDSAMVIQGLPISLTESGQGWRLACIKDGVYRHWNACWPGQSDEAEGVVRSKRSR